MTDGEISLPGGRYRDAAAGALAELVPPHVAIVVAAGCGIATIACFAPRTPAAAAPP